jgi:hypothetical protein
MRSARQPLFYASDITVGQLTLLAFGALEPAPTDVISFEDEAGGDVDRELAVPFLAGMDEFVVTEAELAFRAADMPLDVTRYQVRPGPGGGIALSFPGPVLLRKVVLRHEAIVAPTDTLRLVVRPMADGVAGPPILAAPDFDPPGPDSGASMFARILTGLDMEALGNSRYALTFPDLLGTDWLLQLATGNSAVALRPMADAPTVERIVIAATPNNLSLTLGGSPPIPLWSNPGALMPASGEQRVSFLPIAQRRLGEALAGAAPDAVTLPLTLHFHSDSGGCVEVTHRALDGEYRVRPLGGEPATLRLKGGPAPLVLNAPAGRRPSFGRMSLTARLTGRSLNAGSPPAFAEGAGHGLRATPDRAVAARVPIAPRTGEPAAPVPLASVALRLDTPVAAELVLELRADAAGGPGAIVAPPVVRQFEAGFADWAEFVLAAPLPVPAGTVLWAAIRLTRGTALWHADGGSGAGGPALARVSADRGSSWGDASILLAPPGRLLVQAFHLDGSPQRRPEVRFFDGTMLHPSDWLAGAEADSETEFRVGDFSFPEAILDRLAATAPLPGQLRADTQILLYSPSVLDLVLAGALLGYDPK